MTIQFLGPNLVLFWMGFAQRRKVPATAWLAAGVALLGTALITRAWEYQSLDPRSLEPAVGAVSAWIVLGQMLDGVQVVGGLAVVCSITVIQHVTSNVAPDAPSPHPI